MIVLLTDFIIPIAFAYEYNEDFINDDEYEKEESVASLVIGVLFMVICSVLTCSYTIILVILLLEEDILQEISSQVIV